MPVGYYKQLIKELKNLGYQYLGSAKGSHEKWINRKTDHMAIVPRNLDSRHTANSILKSVGSTKKF